MLHVWQRGSLIKSNNIFLIINNHIASIFFLIVNVIQRKSRIFILKRKRQRKISRGFIEIGCSFDNAKAEKGEKALGGIGCTCFKATGTARVIGGLDETDRLQTGDILVTKFTDTGWTSKFALLGGIVTEYGGILCHAAIVSREYGIPCVVCAENATKLIKDGETVTINGETGEIILGGEKK